MKRVLSIALVVALLPIALIIMLAQVCIAAPVTIKCLSTTSTENSGLTDYLLPMFERKTGIRVLLIARGTGAALEAGKRGDADVVLVHARQDELRLVKEGYFTDRRDIMYNDFIILGPASDPAGIREAATATEAFMRMYHLNEQASDAKEGGRLAPFVSRGDNSGTHKKELSLWKEAGIGKPAGEWYLEVGQGMAKSMRIASEKGAYLLSDRATWIARKDSMHLSVLFEGGSALHNQYGVMAVNPERHPHVKYAEAMAFINWLISSEGQSAIGKFKIDGEQLFFPNARVR